MHKSGRSRSLPRAARAQRRQEKRSQFYSAGDDYALLRGVLQLRAHVAPYGERIRSMKKVVARLPALRPPESKSRTWKPNFNSVESRFNYLIQKRLHDPHVVQCVESEEVYNQRNRALDQVVKEMAEHSPAIRNELHRACRMFGSSAEQLADKAQKKVPNSLSPKTPLVLGEKRDPELAGSRTSMLCEAKAGRRATNLTARPSNLWIQFEPAKGQEEEGVEEVIDAHDREAPALAETPKAPVAAGNPLYPVRRRAAALDSTRASFDRVTRIEKPQHGVGDQMKEISFKSLELEREVFEEKEAEMQRRFEAMQAETRRRFRAEQEERAKRFAAKQRQEELSLKQAAIEAMKRELQSGAQNSEFVEDGEIRAGGEG